MSKDPLERFGAVPQFTVTSDDVVLRVDDLLPRVDEVLVRDR